MIKYQAKQKHLLPFNNSSNKLEEVISLGNLALKWCNVHQIVKEVIYDFYYYICYEFIPKKSPKWNSKSKVLFFIFLRVIYNPVLHDAFKPYFAWQGQKYLPVYLPHKTYGIVMKPDAHNVHITRNILYMSERSITS